MFSLGLFLLAVIFGLLYLAVTVWKAMNYWRDTGVKHLPPWPVVGNLGRILGFDKHWTHYYEKIYYAFPNERMVGLYEFMTPTLVLRDPDLIERVLVREFSTYQDHGDWILDSKNILSDSVFAASGTKWRALRNKLLSAFTTGKMREIFPEMVTSCRDLIDKKPKKLTENLFHEFAVKSFMRSMFGSDVLPAGQEELFRNSRMIFAPTVTRMLQRYGLTYFPKLAEFFGMRFMPKDLNNYFRSLMDTLYNQREKTSRHRNDYTEVLVEMRKIDKMNVYNRENEKVDDTFEMTNEIVISQGFMFFFAGLDTTSLVMLHMALELSLSKECQDKARQEVRNVLKKYGGYSWEAVRDMKYLDQCIQETLRKHPSLQYVLRIAGKETELDGIKIKKGTRVVIPLHTIQMDPKNYLDPRKFDPDRFLQDNLPKKFTHLPFSDGPRVCMGKRFALMEIATLFAHILHNFELSLSPETKLPLQYEPNAVFLKPTAQNPIVVLLKNLS